MRRVCTVGHVLDPALYWSHRCIYQVWCFMLMMWLTQIIKSRGPQSVSTGTISSFFISMAIHVQGLHVTLPIVRVFMYFSCAPHLCHFQQVPFHPSLSPWPFMFIRGLHVTLPIVRVFMYFLCAQGKLSICLLSRNSVSIVYWLLRPYLMYILRFACVLQLFLYGFNNKYLIFTGHRVHRKMSRQCSGWTITESRGGIPAGRSSQDQLRFNGNTGHLG
jgi:hypothetical protein